MRVGGANMLSMNSLFIIKDHLPGYKHYWMYTENELPVMVVARYDQGDKKTYRQFRLEGEEWVEGMSPPPYPLFGLDSLKNRSPLKAVFISEGEKCATVLHQLGWQAIATVLGAQNPAKSNWTPLRYFTKFIILRDNDKAGSSFARSVSCELRRICPDAEIMVVNLTPGVAGGDLIDWLKGTVLLGQKWDGFEQLPVSAPQVISQALQQEILKIQLRVEDCPQVDFKPVEAMFEGMPKSFDIELRSVPSFPLHVLPPSTKLFLEVTSAQFSQVPDFAATTFIASISGLIGRSVQLKMRPSDSWHETTNSWGVLVGSPAAKKSPIMRRLLGFFKELEEVAIKEYTSAKKAYLLRKREAEKNKEDFDEPLPIRRRYITDDVTMPKLRELLAGNPRGLILRNDELKGQLERLERTGSEGDRSFMMSCWSGLEVYSEDRMCRDSSINIPLALTWIGCIPPTALQKYLREAMGRGSGADGFMQRFQFVCYPDQKVLFELSNEALPPGIEDEIKDIFKTLDEEGRRAPQTLFFSKEAQRRFDEWLVKHENDARSGKHPIYWESHLGKQAKALAVLVIILHRLLDVIGSCRNNEVQLQTLEGALVLQAYFEAHARRCYDSVVGGTIDDAKTILELLKQKRLPPRFKAQDIYHAGLAGLQDSNRVRAALDLLQNYNWLVVEKVPGTNGRKHEFWILHPRAFEKG